MCESAYQQDNQNTSLAPVWRKIHVIYAVEFYNNQPLYKVVFGSATQDHSVPDHSGWTRCILIHVLQFFVITKITGDVKKVKIIRPWRVDEYSSTSGFWAKINFRNQKSLIGFLKLHPKWGKTPYHAYKNIVQTSKVCCNLFAQQWTGEISFRSVNSSIWNKACDWPLIFYHLQILWQIKF